MTNDLVRRLRNLVGQYIGDADIDDELQGAADRIEELEHLFDLRWAADMRAIRLWQSAHPDQPRTWPDHADLGTWCLSRIEKLEAALREIADCCTLPAQNDSEMREIARKALEGKDE